MKKIGLTFLEIISYSKGKQPMDRKGSYFKGKEKVDNNDAMVEFIFFLKCAP